MIIETSPDTVNIFSQRIWTEAVPVPGMGYMFGDSTFVIGKKGKRIRFGVKRAIIYKKRSDRQGKYHVEVD